MALRNLRGAFESIFSGIVIAVSRSSAVTNFFGYTKRSHADDVRAVLTINGVSEQDTAARKNLHRTYGVRFPFQRHDVGYHGWMMFHQDKSVTIGHTFNITLEPEGNNSHKALAARENGCVATNTCGGSYEAEVIMNFNDPGGAAPEDEAWDNDDWTQLALSIVDQLQAAAGDMANFEIDNPFAIVLSGTLECDLT